MMNERDTHHITTFYSSLEKAQAEKHALDCSRGGVCGNSFWWCCWRSLQLPKDAQKMLNQILWPESAKGNTDMWLMASLSLWGSEAVPPLQMRFWNAECRGAGNCYLCHLLGDFLLTFHPFGLDFTTETHISKGELALKDYQWLCRASRDRGKKQQMEKQLSAPTGYTLRRRGAYGNLTLKSIQTSK